MKSFVVVALIGLLTVCRSEASPDKKASAAAPNTAAAPKMEYVRFHNETAAQFNEHLKHIFMSRREPDYPDEALRNGWQGSGSYRVILDTSGKVTAVQVIESAGKEVLDDEIKRALRVWRAKPGPPRVVELPVTFRLPKNSRSMSPSSGVSDPSNDHRFYVPPLPAVAPGNR